MQLAVMLDSGQPDARHHRKVMVMRASASSAVRGCDLPAAAAG